MRIYYVFQGGFDTHSGRKQRHDRLMTEQHKIDFRSVYATVQEKWLGTNSEPILGQKYPLLDVRAS